MGSVHGTITISFDDDGVDKANREVDKFKDKFQKLGKDLDKTSSGISSVWVGVARTIGMAALALTALSGGIQIVGGLVQVVIALAGALAIIPGAFAALGVVIGVLALAKDGFKELGTQLADLKPGFDQLKLDVQRALFKGIADEVRLLAKEYMPDLRAGLTGVARELNLTAFEFSGFLKQAQTQKDVNELMTVAARIVANFRAALVPVLSVLRDVGITGAQVFEEITRGIGQAATDFAGWVSNVRASGQLREWMLGGVEAIKQLIQIVLMLGGIFGEIFAAFDAAGADFLGTIVQMIQAVAQFLSSVEGQAVLQQFAAALKEIGASVSGFLLQSLKELTPALIEALPAFAKLITSLTKMLLPVIEKLAPAIENVAVFIGQNSDAIAGALIAIGALVAAFKIAAIAAGILNAILLLNPYVLIAAAIIALVALIIIYWDEIVAVTKKAWQAVLDFLSGVWNNIVEIATSVWGGITDFFKRFWPVILALFTGPIGLIVGLVIKHWDQIKAFTTSVWNAILDFLKSIGTALYNVFVQPLVDLANFVMGIWQRIVTEVSTFLRPIIEIISGIFEIIHTIISTVLELIWLLIQRVWMDIQTTTTTIWNAIVGFLTSIWNSIVEQATFIWNAVSTTISTVWNFLVSLFHTLFDPLVAWWTGLWTSIQNAITTVNQAIGDFVSRKWQEIKDFLIRTFGPIVQWFIDIWNRVSQSVNDGVNNVMNFIRGLPGQILGAVGNAASWLYNAGKDVVLGFLNGVRDMVGRAVAEVKRMASDVIAGAKSILGIRSPSTVFKAFGQYTMEGYIVGIDQMINPVLDAVAAVATGIVERGTVPPVVVNPAMTAGIGTSTVSGGDGASLQPVVIEGDLHLHVAGNLDPTDPVKFRQTIVTIDQAIRKVGVDGRENK